MNIVITGASKGIGIEVVKELLREKSNRVLALARNMEELENWAEQHPNLRNRLMSQSFDITHFEAEKCLTEWQTFFSEVDVLINNAGLLVRKSFETLTDEDWQAVFGVNIFGAVRLIRTLLPLLKKSKKAHIVNIGSMGGHEGSVKFSGLSAYSTSKAALANLTECLAEEFKHENIFSNCLMLGAVNTDILSSAFPDYTAPLNADEIAKWIAHFSQTGHHYFNGKLLPVSLSTP